MVLLELGVQPRAGAGDGRGGCGFRAQGSSCVGCVVLGLVAGRPGGRG